MINDDSKDDQNENHDLRSLRDESFFENQNIIIIITLTATSTIRSSS
jgi:hypothetical protein